MLRLATHGAYQQETGALQNGSTVCERRYLRSRFAIDRWQLRQRPPQWRFVAACFSVGCAPPEQQFRYWRARHQLLSGWQTDGDDYRLNRNRKSSAVIAGKGWFIASIQTIVTVQPAPQTGQPDCLPRQRSTDSTVHAISKQDGVYMTPDCLILAESYIVHYQKDFPVQRQHPCTVLFCPYFM